MTEKTTKNAAPRLKTIVAPTGVFPVEVIVRGLDVGPRRLGQRRVREGLALMRSHAHAAAAREPRDQRRRDRERGGLHGASGRRKVARYPRSAW